jgi:hypothetical protein
MIPVAAGVRIWIASGHLSQAQPLDPERETPFS